MKNLVLLCASIFSFVHIESAQELRKKIITPNEQALSHAVISIVIQLSDRPAAYAKQAILIERDMQHAKNEDQKKCMSDSRIFFASLALASNEQEIRSLHVLFADRFIECQKIMHSSNVKVDQTWNC